MGKKSRRKKVVGTPKQFRPPIPHVARPFEGLDYEGALVSMRELLPAATLPAKTTEEYGAREVLFVTILPNQAQASVRGDGKVLVALQTRSHSGDVAHDLGVALQEALKRAEAFDKGEGQPGVVNVDVRDAAPRIGDMISSAGDLSIEDSLSFWFTSEQLEDEQTQAAIEQSSKELVPTKPVPGPSLAFWQTMPKLFVRWVRTEDETKLFSALARLADRDELTLGSGSRFIGAFRALGISIPVFEFPEQVPAAELEEPMAELEKALSEALADSTPLTDAQRSVRAGLVSRQVSVR
ncbi:DUF5926 family protein [Gleimia hominis]|uniref:DUF5926 family protein n=1 Tax=Gleimia hominis TaxID=595468 RepID=A0ABU3I945_9ACTO|nr:DUF5926 family protein [Gleimia hominis]MDT3766886.1 DUF5926 family protein [Gleimia hominis]